MPWIRWDTSYLANPKTRRLSWEAAAAFPLVALWAKELNRNGEVPAGDLDPENLAALLTARTAPSADACSSMVREWLSVGYLVRDGDVYRLPSWDKFKPDSTAAERMQRYRNERNERNVTAVTTTGRDVTGRDGTGDDDQETPDGVLSAPVPEHPRRTARMTYARACRDATWTGQDSAKLAASATTALDFILGHPWMRQIDDAPGWVAVQEADRPGVGVLAELIAADRWLLNKGGARKDPARFLSGWLDRARSGRGATTIAAKGGYLKTTRPPLQAVPQPAPPQEPPEPPEPKPKHRMTEAEFKAVTRGMSDEARAEMREAVEIGEVEE